MTIGILDIMKGEAKTWTKQNEAAESALPVTPTLTEDGAIGQHAGVRLAADDPHLSIPQANDQQFAKDAEKKSRPAPNAVKQPPAPSGWDAQGAGYTHTTPLPRGGTVLKPAHGQVPAEMGKGKAPTQPSQDVDTSLASMLSDFDRAMLSGETLENPLFNGPPDPKAPIAVAPVAIRTIATEVPPRRSEGLQIPLPAGKPVIEGRIPLPAGTRRASARRPRVVGTTPGSKTPPRISEAIARVRAGESAKDIAKKLRSR